MESMHSSTALLTDQYELTMLQAALADGTAQRQCVFEVFARRLPNGRRYGVVAGTGRFLEALRHFRFGRRELDYLRSAGIVNDDTLEYLADYRFSGDIRGYAEGEIYFPGSPVMIVEATFGEAVIIETLALSILNHDSAVASAAARMASAAGDRSVVEMGSRRTHEASAVAAARAAYIAGFSATSNLEAGRTWGVPTMGTAAHAFTLLHDNEHEAFAAQIRSQGRGTTVLVDTYDVDRAVRAAVEIAGPELGAVRLDSGDLVSQAGHVRRLLDGLGAEHTKIVVTSDLDEYAIAALQSAPVDSYGVGTSVVTGSGAPAAGMVYKMVARDDGAGGAWTSVAKTSPEKLSVGGRKDARRQVSRGRARAELLSVAGPGEQSRPDDHGAASRPLLTPLVRGGEVVAPTDTHTAREHHATARAELPLEALRLSAGEPAIPTRYRTDTPDRQ